jgi:NADH-quinone oxidoreductase subunit G
MPKIIIDGQEHECRVGITVLQAALEAGFDVPHYCYHPGLSVVASCRLCLMEIKIADRKTKEMVWGPKLVPSCQTFVRDGTEVRFNTDRVKTNQKRVMEDLLLNHPLDCPVCDQAGECYLQDYSLHFGDATSRMVEPKHVNPKKDIGPRTLLYQDRCVLCSRCVRFTQEISGTGELCVVNRGNRAEIDVFPGIPLANKLQGNVVDICPVGALLDKDFLFQQRVWLLKGTESICPGCSTGCSIRVDHNQGKVYRLKPRHSPDVNDWWICDDGRFGWKYVHDERRLTTPTVRGGPSETPVRWEEVPELIRTRLARMVEAHGGASVAVQLSPMMACEEAWLLAKFIRSVAAEATLTLGDVPTQSEDECFPAGCSASDAKFIIRGEKAPNARGVEAVLESAGGTVLAREEVWERAARGEFAALWVVGGYPTPDWPTEPLVSAAKAVPLLIAQDILPNPLTAAATITIPSCAWVEREGTFLNATGLIQPFERAINPPDSARADGQFLYELAGYVGLYRGDRVREMMAQQMPAFAEIAEAPPAPVHQH